MLSPEEAREYLALQDVQDTLQEIRRRYAKRTCWRRRHGPLRFLREWIDVLEHEVAHDLEEFARRTKVGAWPIRVVTEREATVVGRNGHNGNGSRPAQVAPVTHAGQPGRRRGRRAGPTAAHRGRGAEEELPREDQGHLGQPLRRARGGEAPRPGTARLPAAESRTARQERAILRAEHQDRAQALRSDAGRRDEPDSDRALPARGAGRREAESEEDDQPRRRRPSPSLPACPPSKAGSRVFPHFPMLDESDNVRQGFLEPAQFEELLKTLPKHLADAAEFAGLTGWRKGQIAKLEWTHVDRTNRLLVVPGALTKNRKPQTLPLAGRLWEVIERRWLRREVKRRKRPVFLAPLVFHRGDGKPLGDIRNARATACEQAEVPGLLFHDLRRSGVRNLIRAGVDPHVVMKISGHRTPSMLQQRYNVIDTRDQLAAFEQLEKHLAEAPQGSNVKKIR